MYNGVLAVSKQADWTFKIRLKAYHLKISENLPPLIWSWVIRWHMPLGLSQGQIKPLVLASINGAKHLHIIISVHFPKFLYSTYICAQFWLSSRNWEKNKKKIKNWEKNEKVFIMLWESWLSIDKVFRKSENCVRKKTKQLEIRWRRKSTLSCLKIPPMPSFSDITYHPNL